MIEQEFWNLLESTAPTYDADTTAHQHSQNVMALLAQKSDQDLVDYDSYINKFIYELLDFEFWAVAMLVPDKHGDQGCSDDTFTDFCAGIISRGQKTFGTFKRNPDSVVEIPQPQLLKSGEVFLLAAQSIYKKRYGEGATLEENENIRGNRIIDIDTDNWDFSDYSFYSRKFPKSLAKWGFPR